MILINVANLSWISGRLKRNQAIFEKLLLQTDIFSKGLFINPPEVEQSGISKYVGEPKMRLRYSDSSLQVLTLKYSALHWHILPWRRRWAVSVAQMIWKITEGEPYLIWMNTAGRLQAELASILASRASLRIFDASDDFTAWEGPEYPAQLRRVVALCDLVTCVNEHVASTIDHPNKIVFSNCTDFNTFQQVDPDFRLEPWYPKPEGAIYIGFTGGINETRADEPLLQSLFERFPQYQFLFVGYTDNPSFVQRLTRHPNVFFIPEIPYKQLPNLIRGFDVAIVPHRDNAVTRGNDLLKILDYLACGVPVVSTQCSNVEQYGHTVKIAESPSKFGDLIEDLVLRRIVHRPEQGYDIAQRRDWAVQVPQLAAQVFGSVVRTSGV